MLRKMKLLRDVSLRQVPVVDPSASLDEVIALLEDEPLKLVVLVGDEQFMGVFDEDARLSPLIPAGEDLSLLQVGPYVHPSRVIADVSETVEAVLAHMIRRGVEIIPVIDKVIYRGIITRTDLEKV